jgi:hypothetical protein
MTIGQKLHQTLNSIDSAQIQLKTFSMDTQDQKAKQQFVTYANQLESISQGLRNRINYAEEQEPQYQQYNLQQMQQNQNLNQKK